MDTYNPSARLKQQLAGVEDDLVHYTRAEIIEAMRAAIDVDATLDQITHAWDIIRTEDARGKA